MRSPSSWGVVPKEPKLPTQLPNVPKPRDDHRGAWLHRFEFKDYGKQRSTPEKFDQYDERLYQ
jgi:hypothetical protein